MQLGSSNSIDTTTLKGFIRYLTHSIDDVDAFSDAQITASLNRAQDDLQIDILNATNWTLKGSTATQDLVADQANYTFPTGFLKIDHMEVDYLNATNTWKVANPAQFDMEENRAYSNTANNQSIRGSRTNPRYYIFGDTGFTIDPPAETTITNGIKIWHTTKVTNLSAVDSEPIFPEFSHKYLCYEASIELLIPRDSNSLIKNLEAKKQELWERILKMYAKRIEDRRMRLRRANISIK